MNRLVFFGLGLALLLLLSGCLEEEETYEFSGSVPFLTELDFRPTEGVCEKGLLVYGKSGGRGRITHNYVIEPETNCRRHLTDGGEITHSCYTIYSPLAIPKDFDGKPIDDLLVVQVIDDNKTFRQIWSLENETHLDCSIITIRFNCNSNGGWE